MKKLSLLLFAFCILPLAAEERPFSYYSGFSAVCQPEGDPGLKIAFRKFMYKKIEYLAAVDPDTMQTKIIPAKGLATTPCSMKMIEKFFSKSAYIKTKRWAESNSKALLNAGIRNIPTAPPGITLTVDLCPSRLPMDRNVFTKLIQELGTIQKPIPIAIAISGRWMAKHQKDLAWLRDLESQGTFAILWINHTYTHLNKKNLAFSKNFLLTEGVNLSYEILENEKKMIMNGITPTIFFRFPGLISNSSIFKRITSLGLIPIGSDSWLGKNQWPKKGSIVLIHSNGNEQIGIKRFLKLIRLKHEKITNRLWQLNDLRKSLVEAVKYVAASNRISGKAVNTRLTP